MPLIWVISISDPTLPHSNLFHLLSVGLFLRQKSYDRKILCTNGYITRMADDKAGTRHQAILSTAGISLVCKLSSVTLTDWKSPQGSKSLSEEWDTYI